MAAFAGAGGARPAVEVLTPPVLDRASQLHLISEAILRAGRLGKIEIPSAPAAPDSFSLAQYQSPFASPSQGDRGTCWAFAAAAALEAAYRRQFGLSLNLSEEYIFHVGKAFEILRDTYIGSASPVENNSSLTGFQGSSDIAEKISLFAVPEESFAPYLPSNQSLENVVKSLGYSGSGALMSQEDFDAFEFCEAHVPLLANVNAKYRAASWASLGSQPSSDAIEKALLAKREVIADVYHKVPPVGGHVLLINGFDRRRQLFFAKNSWGETDFIEIRYKNDPNFDINAGHYIKEVVDPRFVQNEACWLGNWWMSFRGKTGRLLIRRFIDFRNPTEPTKLGNYYVDGQKYEVNGKFQDGGKTIDMFVAGTPGKVKPGTLQGAEVRASLNFKDIFNARGAATDGTPALLSRYATRFAGIWRQGVTDPWQARHGLTAAQYQTAFDQLTHDGYRLVQVCGYSEGSEARYAAIWSKSAGSAWEAHHGMTAAEYQKTFDDMSARGYRLNWVCGYSQSGTAHYAAIWELAPGVAWQARHGLDLARYQQTFDQLAAQGYALAQVSGYGDGFV